MQTQYKGYTIELERESTYDSPRDWDNLGTMVCFHNRYNLGDKHDFESPEELTKFLDDQARTGSGIDLPLYLYDHSGITISTKPFNDQWDSGKIGYIYVTDEQIKDEYDDEYRLDPQAAYAKARKVLEQEVETYDTYLQGDIWHMHTTTPNGDSLTDCGEFYGQDEALREAKADIDHDIARHPSERDKHTAPFASAMHN